MSQVISGGEDAEEKIAARKRLAVRSNLPTGHAQEVKRGVGGESAVYH